MSGRQQHLEELAEVDTDLRGHRAPGSSHLSPLVQQTGTSFPLSRIVLCYCSKVFDIQARFRGKRVVCYTVIKGCLFSLQLLKSDLNTF